MAKRKGSKESPVTLEVQELLTLGKPARDFAIMGASLKDEYCNYSYEIIAGVGITNTYSGNGKHVVLDDMLTAFHAFNVHLAALDSAFKIAGEVVGSMKDVMTHEITLGYRVQGFKIKGTGEHESVSLFGTKYSDVAKGWLSIVTPFIPIDALSFYQWYNELKEVTDQAREEVALYHEGKYRIEEDDNQDEDGKGKKRKVKQLTIASPEGLADNPEPEEEPIDDFAEARR
jgi:hypothetical protein